MIQLTNTSLTILMIYSSLSLILKQNHLYTSSHKLVRSVVDLYILQTTNISNKPSTIFVETITSTNAIYSKVTSMSSTSNNNQMIISPSTNTTTTSSSINTTTTLSATSIPFSTTFVNNLCSNSMSIMRY